MIITDDRPRRPPLEDEREGDMGEGSFSETHQGQGPTPPNVKGPKRVPIPSKERR
jgi:hypothetical protein